MGCIKCNYSGIIYNCLNCYGEAEYDVEFEKYFCNNCEMLHEDYSVASGDCHYCSNEKNDEIEINVNKKKLIFFFDTETNGLPINFNSDIGDISNWPRIVQIAYQIYDTNNNHIKSENLIIKPIDFTISDESIKIHKITNDFAKKEGINIEEAIKIINKDSQNIEIIVGHNLGFDYPVLNCEYKRLGLINPFENLKQICTMLWSTEYCAIKYQNGYKWPKLSELHYKLFGYNFDEAHNASIDIKATVKCFWQLVENCVITLPKSENLDYKLINSKETENSLIIDEKQLIPYRKGNLWGYCYHNKEMIIEPIYERTKIFKEGLAPVKINGKWGFINDTGKFVIPPDYTRATHFKNDKSYVVFNDNLYKIDKNLILELIRKKGEWEWCQSLEDNVAEAIEILIENEDCYHKIMDFGKNPFKWQLNHEGLSGWNEYMIPMFENDKFGFQSLDIFDKQIPAIFDNGYDFESGLAYVEYNGKWGYINFLGTRFWED